MNLVEAVIYLSLSKGLFGMTLNDIPEETRAQIVRCMDAINYAENMLETQMWIEQMTKMTKKNDEEEDDDDAGSTDDQ